MSNDYRIKIQFSQIVRLYNLPPLRYCPAISKCAQSQICGSHLRVIISDRSALSLPSFSVLGASTKIKTTKLSRHSNDASFYRPLLLLFNALDLFTMFL
jgi:hypothetical protein